MLTGVSPLPLRPFSFCLVQAIKAHEYLILQDLISM